MTGETSQTYRARVRSVIWQTDDIRLYELRPVDAPFAPFTAGAHIDLHLANGLMRSYSLCNSENDEQRYVIGVARDARSRGGSTFVHQKVGPGDILTIAGPRNNFPVAPAAFSLLFAGGIGITPILSMVQKLAAEGRDFRLHYATRSRAATAFLDELKPFGERVILHCDDEQGRFIDVPGLLGAAPVGAHLYCCGPNGMLEAFRGSTAGIDQNLVHVEYFAPVDAAATEGGFTVELALSKRTVEVRRGQTILDALLAAGIDHPYSCREGICGACETPVLSGEPDHRDTILSEAERKANKTMMVCCSGSKSGRLVLDI